MEATIFWDIRVPRVATAFIAGMALALSGMAFQAMVRNLLSTPFTLGVLVQNSGYGLATNVRIASQQPKIVENRESPAIATHHVAELFEKSTQSGARLLPRQMILL